MEDIMAKFNEKYFGKQAYGEYAIEKMLSEGEEILWQGKPKKKAYVLAAVFRMMPFALIWLLFDGAVIGIMIKSDVFEEAPAYFVLLIVAFFAFHLIPVWIWISNIITSGMRHKNIEYAFTNTRIIIKTGLVGIDIANIYYADVENINLRVGAIDRILHVGDIYISSSEKAQVLWDIENPYEITAKLQKIVNDIKTDTYYPNNLRPSSNNGFNTKYKGT